MRLPMRLGTLHQAVRARQDILPLRVGQNTLPPLRTASHILDLLEQLTAAVWADPTTGATQKARTVGYLTSVALKAIEVSNLASRVEMLEEVLKRRSAGSNP